MEQVPDQDLLERTARGDMRAFRALVERHFAMGMRVAERMLGNRQDAEDVMQETCLKIWRESPRWKPQAKFSTWLYRVVLNACIDRKRRTKPFFTNDFDDVLDEAPIAEERLMAEQRSARVREVMQQLTDRQRAAIVMDYFEEHSNHEAAQTMGVALGAYQQLLFRARQNLRFYLAEEGQDDVRTGSPTKRMAGLL